MLRNGDNTNLTDAENLDRLYEMYEEVSIVAHTDNGMLSGEYDYSPCTTGKIEKPKKPESGGFFGLLGAIFGKPKTGPSSDDFEALLNNEVPHDFDGDLGIVGENTNPFTHL